MMKFLVIAGVIGLLSAGTGWMAVSAADSARPDCPGKIVCPLTGDEVCADQCPKADRQRGDCPGKVECPVTSEPVCADRCPADASAVSSKAADELCGGACPAPTPKPDKPRGEGDQQRAVAIPASSSPLTGGCCR